MEIQDGILSNPVFGRCVKLTVYDSTGLDGTTDGESLEVHRQDSNQSNLRAGSEDFWTNDSHFKNQDYHILYDAECNHLHTALQRMPNIYRVTILDH